MVSSEGNDKNGTRMTRMWRIFTDQKISSLGGLGMIVRYWRLRWIPCVIPERPLTTFLSVLLTVISLVSCANSETSTRCINDLHRLSDR